MKKSIFDNTSKIDKIDSLKLFKYNKKWCFNIEGKKYYLTPSLLISKVLSPHILIPEQLINYGCKINNINSNEISVFYSQEEFLNYQIKLQFNDFLLNGWLYDIYYEKSIYKELENKKVWTCDYINLFYNKFPNQVYLSVESS